MLHLGLEAIAEGVENAVQLEPLREMGCDLAQRNYFSEPLAAADDIRPSLVISGTPIAPRLSSAALIEPEVHVRHQDVRFITPLDQLLARR